MRSALSCVVLVTLWLEGMSASVEKLIGSEGDLVFANKEGNAMGISRLDSGQVDAFIFKKESGWILEDTIDNEFGFPNLQRFGTRVAISDSAKIIAVTASKGECASADQNPDGTVFLFEKKNDISSRWSFKQRLCPSDFETFSSGRRRLPESWIFSNFGGNLAFVGEDILVVNSFGVPRSGGINILRQGAL